MSMTDMTKFSTALRDPHPFLWTFLAKCHATDGSVNYNVPK